MDHQGLTNSFSFGVLSRREVLQFLAYPVLPAFISSAWSLGSSEEDTCLLIGEQEVDITPPLGVELAGFHRKPGEERRVRAIRQPSYARVLVISAGDFTGCLVSLDLVAVGKEFTTDVRSALWERYEIPPINVHLCATHTHSMPTFRHLRQWGAVPEEYRGEVTEKIIAAVGGALESLLPTRLRVGQAPAPGASFNRTSSQWRTDAEFGPDATPNDRWLDTMLQVAIFDRIGGPSPVICYHFSSHPVCFADEQAGPDWCGTVAERIKEQVRVRPAFFQGHAGDVNPGHGSPWRGEVGQVTEAVSEALLKAIAAAKPINPLPARSAVKWCRLPFDLELYGRWMAAYAEEPEKCTSGHWVNAHFAKAWYEDNAASPWQEPSLLVELGLVRLGELAFVFHPAELYSYYGLLIRHQSRVPHTWVVGYANDFIGYLPDPMAFAKGEYAATTVPKILDLPPFCADAAEILAHRAIELVNT